MSQTIEYVDILDENDNVIGQGERWASLNAGKRVRFAAVFIFNSKGEVLVQQRSEKSILAPNLLDLSAAGGIVAGQSWIDGAYVELQEELGIKTPLEDTGVDIVGHLPNSIGRLFVGYSDGPFKPQEEEVKALFWMEKDELKTFCQKYPFLTIKALESAVENYL